MVEQKRSQVVVSDACLRKVGNGVFLLPLPTVCMTFGGTWLWGEGRGGLMKTWS